MSTQSLPLGLLDVVIFHLYRLFVKKVIYPKIEGVVVCAQGGGNATVNKNITEAIQVLFGIDVHKIKVIKMSSK